MLTLTSDMAQGVFVAIIDTLQHEIDHPFENLIYHHAN
jgi:hypothetical protein